VQIWAEEIELPQEPDTDRQTAGEWERGTVGQWEHSQLLIASGELPVSSFEAIKRKARPYGRLINEEDRPRCDDVYYRIDNQDSKI
jgi:hypothetical protein